MLGIFVIIAVPLLIMGGATAYAALNSTASAAPLSVVQNGRITDLSPGGPAQAIDYTITNRTGAPLAADAVTISFTGASYLTAAGKGAGVSWENHPAGGPAPGCTAADFAIVQPERLNRPLAVGATSVSAAATDQGGTIRMIETGRNQNDCRGTVARVALSVR